MVQLRLGKLAQILFIFIFFLSRSVKTTAGVSLGIECFTNVTMSI